MIFVHICMCSRLFLCTALPVFRYSRRETSILGKAFFLLVGFRWVKFRLAFINAACTKESLYIFGSTKRTLTKVWGWGTIFSNWPPKEVMKVNISDWITKNIFSFIQRSVKKWMDFTHCILHTGPIRRFAVITTSLSFFNHSCTHLGE